MPPDHTEHLLSRVLAGHSHDEVVCWRTRVAAAEHVVRYRWAAKMVRRLYPKRCVADSLPDELEQVADLLPTVRYCLAPSDLCAQVIAGPGGTSSQRLRDVNVVGYKPKSVSTSTAVVSSTQTSIIHQ